MTQKLKGRKAIVTGAGRGIGRAIALRLASDGATVAVTTRGEAAGKETLDTILAQGGRGELISADLSSKSAAEDAVRTAISALGGLDILVHNAADTASAPIGKIGGDTLDRMIDLNLKAAFWLAEAALLSLRKSNAARLLFVSSITGTRVVQIPFSAYGTTKAGLNGFIRAAGAELGPQGIRVNGVEPGATLTDALREHMGEEGVTALARQMPLQQVTLPEEVAAAVAFLASDDAAGITGQTIVVDAGQSLGAAGLLT